MELDKGMSEVIEKPKKGLECVCVCACVFVYISFSHKWVEIMCFLVMLAIGIDGGMKRKLESSKYGFWP